jgi:hypothetical protein
MAIPKYGSPGWEDDHATTLASMFEREPLESFERFHQRATIAATNLNEEALAAYKNDEHVLAEHAALMRNINALLVLLGNGLVPALKIESENIKLRIWAADVVGCLDASLKSLRFRLELVRPVNDKATV